MSANGLRLLSATVLLFVLSSFLMISASAPSSQEAAISTISEAEQMMAKAYEAVLDAEKAGANASGLLARLNEGAELLSEAHMAFEVEDFEEALRSANLASEVGFEVLGEAELLEVEAVNARVNRMRVSMVGSALGVSFVIIAGLLGYGYFKRRYYRRLLKMKSRAG